MNSNPSLNQQFDSFEAERRKKINKDFDSSLNLLRMKMLEEQRALSSQKPITVNIGSDTNQDASVSNENPDRQVNNLPNQDIKQEEDKGVPFDTLNGFQFMLKIGTNNNVEIYSNPPKETKFEDKFAITLEIFLTVYMESLSITDNNNLPEIRINSGTDKEMVQAFSCIAKHFEKAGLLKKCHLPTESSTESEQLDTWFNQMDPEAVSPINSKILEIFDVSSEGNTSKELAKKITGFYLGAPKELLQKDQISKFYKKLNGKTNDEDLSEKENNTLDSYVQKGGIYKALHNDKISQLDERFNSFKSSMLESSGSTHEKLDALHKLALENTRNTVPEEPVSRKVTIKNS